MGGLTSSLSYQHDRVYRMSSDTTFKSAIANMNQLYFHRLINRLETSEKLNLAKRFAWGDMLVMAFDGAFSSQSPYTEHHQWNIETQFLSVGGIIKLHASGDIIRMTVVVTAV